MTERVTFLAETNHRKPGSLGAAFVDWLIANPGATKPEIKAGGHDLKHLRWDLLKNTDKFYVGFFKLDRSEGEWGYWTQTDEGPVWNTVGVKAEPTTLEFTTTDKMTFETQPLPPMTDDEKADMKHEAQMADLDDLPLDQTFAGRLAAIAGEAADIKADLETLREEEQEYYDGMPESFQGGEKGENAQTEIDAMEEAIGQLEEVEGFANE